MSWPIPEIPEKKMPVKPDYKFWLAILLAFVFIGGTVSLFVTGAVNYTQILIKGILPAVLLWFCFFAFYYSRYSHVKNEAALWNQQSKQIKIQWQKWSKKQLTVVANVIFTPEEKGMCALLKEPGEIPAWPEKARPLHSSFETPYQLLACIDNLCEKQCPGYKKQLKKVRVISNVGSKYHLAGYDIAHFWGITPEYADTVERFYPDYSEQGKNLTLLLCLQCWQKEHSVQYSEFVTAQLLMSEPGIDHPGYKVQAGIGRVLSNVSLEKALKMLFDYNEIAKNALQFIWYSNLKKEDISRLSGYAVSEQWELFEAFPFRSLDHSFGPPGPLNFPVAVSLISDVASQTRKPQLFITKDKVGSYLLCLITPELLL
ncbi:hypothetical protein [Kalamiella sp. sgz302252]|uniref:hypothetical protein n=1 Tax=Pantoea sp. sgz302252 TaxID=3341827 RepID=UPI0036D3C6EB